MTETVLYAIVAVAMAFGACCVMAVWSLSEAIKKVRRARRRRSRA